MKLPRPGDLNKVVQIRRAAFVDNGLEKLATFGNHGATIRAKKTDLSDGERWRGAQVSAQISSRFVVQSTNFTRGILHADQIACEGVTFDIVGIKALPDCRDRWLEIGVVAEKPQ
jgi:hypothetical protein